MTTILECTKCNQQVEVTARVLHFPFVCDGCSVLDSNKSEENSEGGDTMELQPAGANLQFEEQEPYFEGLDHADATVENTNELFDQLEEQLAQANADKEALIVDIESLGAQLEKAATVNRITKGAILLALELQESQAFEDLSHSALAGALKKIAELEEGLDLERRYSKYQTEKYKQQNDWLRSEKSWKQERVNYLERRLEWAERGFWQKVFDVLTFKSKPDFNDSQANLQALDPQPA